MRILVFLTLITTIFAFGCAEDMEEKMVEETLTPLENDRRADTPLEKAQEAMQKVNDRRADVFQKAEAEGDFSVLFAASEDIFKEELGFEKEFAQDLVFIWHDIQTEKYKAGELDEAEVLRYDNLWTTFQEQFLNMTLAKSYFDLVGAHDEIIIDYLRISYENPDSSQDELITLFKESIKQGNVQILYPEGF